MLLKIFSEVLIKMTIKNHILNYYNWTKNNLGYFNTSDIHNLSERGIVAFGKRLGSPSTYEREFRRLKEEGQINVDETKHSNKRESTWIINRK